MTVSFPHFGDIKVAPINLQGIQLPGKGNGRFVIEISTDVLARTFQHTLAAAAVSAGFRIDAQIVNQHFNIRKLTPQPLRPSLQGSQDLAGVNPPGAADEESDSQT